MGFRISGLGITTYCKVKAVGDGISLSFAKGMRQFCMMASYHHKKPDEIYIAQIDSDIDCTDGGRPIDLEKGAIRFIKLALYAMKRWFPRVTIIRFEDDSKIKCPRSNLSMRLPLDYIAKYGKTWYEVQFHAQIDGEEMQYIHPESQITAYYQSLEIMDVPHAKSYDDIIISVPGIVPYEAIYRASSTPRDFLNRLRKHLGDKYCEVAAKMLTVYMSQLRILHIPRWKIMMKDVETISDYHYEELSRPQARQLLNGGRRSIRRSCKDAQRTRRKRHLQAHYRFTHEPDQTRYTMADYSLDG